MMEQGRFVFEEARSEPKSKLFGLLSLMGVVRNCSGNRLATPEITDALNHVYDGDIILFDGSWAGLCVPILGAKYPAKRNGRDMRADMICDLFNSRYWEGGEVVCKGSDTPIHPSELMVHKQDGLEIARGLWKFFYPDSTTEDIDAEVEKAYSSEFNQAETFAMQNPCSNKVESAINSTTHDRLLRAIAAFPSRYPEHAKRLPKLDTDIRPWLKETGMATSDREAHVFGSILSEHFNLSPDTQKPQQ